MPTKLSGVRLSDWKFSEVRDWKNARSWANAFPSFLTVFVVRMIGTALLPWLGGFAPKV
jgi:hypothetical protein